VGDRPGSNGSLGVVVTINDLVGTWMMDHDGWTGTLVLGGGDQAFNEVDNGCAYHYETFAGTWSGGAGSNLAVSGRLGGKDPNRRDGQTCPASAHLVSFTVAFPDATPQPFEGYLFTHEPTRMAGYTWWFGQPYAWEAQKQ
jgi:hypothetical protein